MKKWVPIGGFLILLWIGAFGRGIDVIYKTSGIKKLLGNYTRQFTVLELGGSFNSSFSSLITRDYNATCVVLTPDKENKFRNFCQNSDQKNIVLLTKNLSPRELEWLGYCESFDVVIIPYCFLKSYDQHWHRGVRYLFDLADHCVVELPLENIPNISLVKEVVTFVKDSQGELLARYWTDRPMGLFTCYKKKDFLRRLHWDRSKRLKPGEYVVESSFDEKFLFKSVTNQRSSWKHGINLRTYRALYGTYPSPEYVLEQFAMLENLDHNDLNACNLVIQGEKIVPIDIDDTRRNADREKAFNHLMNFFKPQD